MLTLYKSDDLLLSFLANLGCVGVAAGVKRLPGNILANTRENGVSMGGASVVDGLR